MEIDKEALQKHYQQLPDERLMELAYYEANELSAEALEVLKDEINRRNLEGDLTKAADIQAEGLTQDELRALVDEISRFPCPFCGTQESLLNASKVITVKSFLIVTTVEEPLVIACPDCIKASAKRSLNESLSFGWWSIPWGPIKTIASISKNHEAMNTERYLTPTKEFTEFIIAHSTIIKTNIDKVRDLNELLDLIY
jgi:hypothetical protein